MNQTSPKYRSFPLCALPSRLAYNRAMKLRCWLVLAGVLLVTATHAQGPANAGDAALHALFDREWEWELTQDPLWASYLGDRRWNDQWPDIGANTLAARHAHRQAVLKDSNSIPGYFVTF